MAPSPGVGTSVLKTLKRQAARASQAQRAPATRRETDRFSCSSPILSQTAARVKRDRSQLGGLPPGGEQQAHGVNELLRLEGFGDVEDAAQLLRLLVGLDLLGGGEEADGDVRRAFGRLQLGAQLKAIELRRLDVEQDGVGDFHHGLLKRL